jgi:hypothetical protein
MYYNLLFTFIRLALEFNWLLCRSGNQWGSALPFWGFCIPHIIVTGFSYILFSLTIQGSILAVVPYPFTKVINLYPYVFDENMGLQIALYNFGCLMRSGSMGLWRVKHLTEPTDRAIRSMAAGVLGITNNSSVGGVILSYIKVPYNYVSEQVISRVISGIRENLPSTPNIPVPSFVSSAASGISSSASAIGTGISDVASGAAQYLPFWKGTGGALLKDIPTTIEYNKLYPITNKTYNLNMFDKELNQITFLNKSQQSQFNISESGKRLHKLKVGLDKIFTRQLNYLIKNDSLRGSMYLVFMEKLFNYIDMNIPVFIKGLNRSLKTYNLVLKNNIQLISVKSIFPELINTDPISPVYPPFLIFHNTGKTSKNLSQSFNPEHVKQYLTNTLQVRKTLRKKGM